MYATTGKLGDAYGYDIRTGKMLWRFKPQSEEFDSTPEATDGADFHSTKDKGSPSRAWKPATDMVGIDRPGDNLFSNCVVALDVMTGKRLWHFQTVAQNLGLGRRRATEPRDGYARRRRVDAVTGLSKGGTLVFSIAERETDFPVPIPRAPVSTFPGERQRRINRTRKAGSDLAGWNSALDDITDRTPEAREFVQKIVRALELRFLSTAYRGKVLALYWIAWRCRMVRGQR